MPLTDNPVNVCELPPLQFPLVNRFYQANGDKSKARGGERVLVLKQGSQLLSALRACPQAQGHWLRSVCVAKHARGAGLGTQLLKHTRLHLNTPCWCFPFAHLKYFYQQAGYKEVSTETAPATIAQRYQRYTLKHPDWLLMAHD